MSAIAAVALSSLIAGNAPSTSATVACDKTYSPENTKGGIARWVDRSGGIALGYPSLTFQLRAPTKESRVYKMSAKLFSPVLETIDPAVGIFGPKLAYSLQAHLDVLLPERSTSAERTAFLSLLRSLLLTSIQASDGAPDDQTYTPVKEAILSFEDVY